MCRTGLKEEENIKKARGQALINFRRLAQVISKTSLGSLCFHSFAFVCSFFPPLSPHSLPSQSQPLSPGQQQDKLLPLLKPGSQPVGTQCRCRGLLALSPRRPHVSRQGRVCSGDRGAQGWSAARSPQPPAPSPKTHRSVPPHCIQHSWQSEYQAASSPRVFLSSQLISSS